MGRELIEGLPFSHGPVPGDLSPEMRVLLINGDKLNVPCALPTQLTDIIQSSEPSAYRRAFLSVCVFSRFILKDLDHFMTSLYRSIMVQDGTAASSGMKHNIWSVGSPGRKS